MRPTTTEIELPLLHEIVWMGGDYDLDDDDQRNALFRNVASHFPDRTENDLTEKKPSNPDATLWESQVHGARNQLVRKGDLHHQTETFRGFWKITELGAERLRQANMLP